jgi:hypothetical protein
MTKEKWARPSLAALDSGSTGALPETLEQLDELVVSMESV